MKTRDNRKEVKVMLDLLIWLIKLPFVLLGWLIKLPFVLLAVALVVVFGLIGVILSLLGVGLTPVLGIGLLILPIGLIFLLAAHVIARLL
jgi:hypothetical protein